MRHILLLTLALYFTACTPIILENSSKPSTSTESQPASETTVTTQPLPQTMQDSDDNDLKIIDEESLIGNYVLKRGLFGTQEISEGYLIIEELDVDNYGYYYVTIAENFTPETHTGIFYNKGGKYVQKVIEDSSEEEIRLGKKKYKISIIDNLTIKQEGELLKLYINSDKKENLLWERDVDEKPKSEKMQESLREAKHEYEKFYKEKCQATTDFCAEEAYTRVND